MSGFAWWLLNHLSNKPVIVNTAGYDEAEDLYDDLTAFSAWRKQKGLSPNLPEIILLPDEDKSGISLALAKLIAASKPFLLVMPANAAESIVSPPEKFLDLILEITPGATMVRHKFLDKLASAGYMRTEQVESVGELAIRGEVTDLWIPGEDTPLRLTWNYDRIESIKKIDLYTQRAAGFLNQARIVPVEPGAGSNVEFFINTLIPDSPMKINQSGFDSAKEGFEPVPVFAANLKVLARQLMDWRQTGWEAVIFCFNKGEQERMTELLEYEFSICLGHSSDWFPEISIGPLRHGFVSGKERLAVLSHGEIFGRKRHRLKLPKFSGGSALTSLCDIKSGDYAVHERFGIGRFDGLSLITARGMEAEYLALTYRGGDKLYVPVHEFKQVQKFIGAEGKRPKLSSLDTAAWENTKNSVKEGVQELARELLKREAVRMAKSGFAFERETRMEREFADSFMYELTPDQAKAIKEVLADMESPRPMDRLVCGDVGYGKTEVAMRASLKAVVNSRQVAIVVPTTILAEQHYNTFRERFADFPVNVTMLSRFVPPGDQKKILNNLARGMVDIIIGTHRLLGKDVILKDLGVVIIDEEHRFGVKQKEKLKAIRETVDILALTATPIPRTLFQALSALRGLSVIETPPEGRLPIITHVGAYDDKTMAAAVEHEFSRKGQVFYVHNRVATLEACKAKLINRLPGVRIISAHGQMSGRSLEKIMWDFSHGRYDILLSTTIIESGLDIPNVNTLIVEEAEEFGLAQLYQLRGRVGRENRQAYCYLFHSNGELAEEAGMRLQAIKEFATLGSGFKLAMADLEIRGAGNLVGQEQHGFINTVGVDLYSQLLSEEIKKQKAQAAGIKVTGNLPALPEPCSIELSISAYIPEEYMPSSQERIASYRRLAGIISTKEVQDIKEEFFDRCGHMPEPVKNLLAIVELRLLAESKGMNRLVQINGNLELTFRSEAQLSDSTVKTLLKSYHQQLQFLPGPPWGLKLALPGGSGAGNTISFAKELLSAIE